MIYLKIIVFSLLLIILLVKSNFSSEVIKPIIEDSFIIKTESDAVKRALEYTGFDKLKDFDIEKAKGEVELIIARDSTTPFLADSINGKVGWSVEFKDLILDLDHTSNDIELINLISFVIYIDAEYGRLLKIITYKKDKNDINMERASAEITNLELNKLKLEEYISIPSKIPILKYFDAINQKKVGLSPFNAYTIIAQHFLYINNGVQIKIKQPAWIITYYFTPPNGKTVPQKRFIINSETGNIISNLDIKVNPEY